MEQAPDQRLATAVATGRISDRGGADGQQHQPFTLVSPTASEDGVGAEQDAELGSADGHIDSQTPAEAQSGESGEGVGAGKDQHPQPEQPEQQQQPLDPAAASTAMQMMQQMQVQM